MVLAIALAWFTYRFLERPARATYRAALPDFFLVVAMSCLSCAGYYIDQNSGLKLRRFAVDSSDLSYDWSVQNYQHCNIEALGGKKDGLHFCLYDPLREADSVIIGDSHAEDKFHGLVALDMKNRWMLMGHSSCPPVINISVVRDQKGCEEKFKKIFTYLTSNPRIKNVVLSFCTNCFNPVAYAADHVDHKNSTKVSSSMFSGNADELFFAELDSAVKLLIDNGKRVTLFIDVPELPFYPRDCIKNPLKDCSLAKGEVMARQERLRNTAKNLKSSHPQLIIYDPIELFCEVGRCSYKKDGVILYRDSHHLSLRGSTLYAQQWMKSQ